MHWPYRVEELQGTSSSSILVEADFHNRPQKMKYKLLMSSTLHSHSHHRKAHFDSWPYPFCKNLKDNEIHGAADLDDRPKFFLPSSFSIYSVDLTCGRTNLNYTGSSALILSQKIVRTKPHFKRCNPVVCRVKSR
jgi:hypothetical protein